MSSWDLAEVERLQAKYPLLKIRSLSKIEGRLSFQMLRCDGEFIISPGVEQLSNTKAKDFLYESDMYDISIHKPSGEPFPIVRETGGRLIEVARKENKKLDDMHQYPNGTLCLASSMQLEQDFNDGMDLLGFVEQHVIPYLFAQTVFARTGEWVWGELNHGFIGLLQWLGRLESWSDDDIELTFKWLQMHRDSGTAMKALDVRWRAHKACLCGSGGKMRDCHPEVKKAIAIIRVYVNRGLITKDDSLANTAPTY